MSTSLYMVVLLVSLALALSLALGAPGPTPTPEPIPPALSQLPQTFPGLSRDEGVFLVTAADDGSRVAYFIAANTRHNISPGDLALEQQLNPLWPIRAASREEVLTFSEAVPIGRAKPGLVSVPVEAPTTAEEDPSASAVADAPSPAMAEPPSPAVGEVPKPAVTEAPKPAVAEVPKPAVAEVPKPAVAEVPKPAVGETAKLITPSSATGAPKPVAMPVAPAPQARAVLDAPAGTEQSLLDLAPTEVVSTSYVLQRGDNLTRISERFGTTVEAVLAANGITDPNRIYFGLTLVIPGAVPPSDVAETPTAPQPAADEPLPVAAEPAPPPVADTPKPDAVAATYTVKPGDSAISIARKFGVNLDQLLAENEVTNPNRVLIGQILTIPG